MTLLNTTIPRILGACFYYPPDSDAISRLRATLPELADLFPWPDAELVRQKCESISAIDSQRLIYDYSVLFEGQGVMPAPPWSSVYLESENLLMGASTLAYRDFLSRQGIVTDTDNPEPDDQFGLMLMAFAYLIESDKPEAAASLLSEHLLPWAGRYLELVQQTETEQPFYPVLAEVAGVYLARMKQGMNLQVNQVELYL
ncbi:TorD/DmsD family molecular chaperone [Budvicia diplopodorum]|uniref:TorD/DmsD family molecular chaperone n=1 Tax=Budvicia diplopodorum TaxID=1119056 RepID=UPI001FE2D7B1|nr:molecular chaperone [Budvicia diplopodorum]